MLVSNDKRIIFLSVLSLVIGFTFLFTITSLSGTIIKTKQDSTTKTYGKFLMVIPEVDKKDEKSIKQRYSHFSYEHFSMIGNVEHLNKEVPVGVMKESQGEDFGFKVIKGEWPKTSNQIIVEEYVMELFGIENEKLPIYVSLKRDGKQRKYEITGVISNYSYLLSTSYDGYLETKVYPSIICGEEKSQNINSSLVISQKKLDFKKAQNDINYLLSEIESNHICVNEKLYNNGYEDNRDMINTRTLYLVLLNVLLVLEQIIIIRTFLLRNKKTLFLFQALGMSEREKRKVIFYLMQGMIFFSMLLGYLLSILTGYTYMSNTFREYNKFYMCALHYNVLTEVVIVIVALLVLYLLYRDDTKESIIKEMIGEPSKKQKKHKFEKISFSIVMIETICILFTMASFYFVNSFQDKSENIEFYLYSKRTTVSYPLREYNIAMYGNDFFSFNTLQVFHKYKDRIRLSTEAETKQSTILLKEDNIDSYFRKYLKNNDTKLKEKDKELWKQVSKKAGQYRAIPASKVDIVVLPQREFQNFLKQKGIHTAVLEKKTEKACVLLLPNYKKDLTNPSMREKGTIQLGRMQGNEENAEFYIENFKIGALRGCDEEESGNIQVIMNENVAKKSKIVMGYDTIHVEMKKNTPLSIQKGVKQKISLVMASIQGGLLDSSGIRDQEDRMLRNYTSIMSNTMLFFCIIVIWIYITLSVYIDWEKNSHEYGVLRSFGMSYFTLQNKLFFKYNNSIIIACIFGLLFGRYIFTGEMLSKQQMLFSIGLTVAVTYFCRIWVFYCKKNQSISSMVNKG